MDNNSRLFAVAIKTTQDLSLPGGLLSLPLALTSFPLHWPSYEYSTLTLPNLRPPSGSLRVLLPLPKDLAPQLFPELISSRNLAVI